jgi:hypothetical protein
VTVRHTLHNITSENGEKLVQLALAHNLEISSIRVQHRRIHKSTWKAPGQDSCNQIVRVLINLQLLMFVHLETQVTICISNQRDVTLSSYLILLTLHVSGVSCPSSGVT